MHRRGNKSKKVPNVRLRPAQPGAMARARGSPEPTSYWDPDSQKTTIEDTVIPSGSCPRPFKNIVVCSTGVLDKAALSKLASELGATSVSAFTDRVTHLVAETHGGPKYFCALERKIPIMLPSWITESHRIWQHGDDVDLAQSVATHRLPVFSGVTLCTSGIDIVRRTKINKLLTAAGGTYLKALERPVRVTHLLCASDAETEEMRYADKFNTTGEADPPIQLVWEEWFWDSLEFGGRFDETAYNARSPRPERRVAPASQSPQIAAAETQVASVKTPDAADNEDELVPVQRLPSTTLQLWGSLLKTRGYEVSRGGVMLSPGKARQMVLQGHSDEPTQEQIATAGASVISSFRRANSFVLSRPTAAAAGRESSAGPSRLPFGRTNSTWNINGNSEAGPSSPLLTKPPEEKDPNAPAFTGLRFLLRGETNSATARKAIEGAGGTVVRGGDADYIIVRLNSGSALYLAETSAEVRARYRSECWLESCLLDDRICAPDEHASFMPLDIPLPVAGADRVTLSFSGLEVSEACWVRRLLETLGITLAPAFSRNATHLLCPSGTGAKYERALQWGVPVVDMRWLAAVARTGIVPAVHAFLVSPTEPDAAPEAHPHLADDSVEGGKLEKVEETVQSSSHARAALLTVPSSQLRRGMSVSPPKIPEHRTKALKESIASLLGKRPAIHEESEAPAKRGRTYRSGQNSDALPVLVPPAPEQESCTGSDEEGPSIDSDEQSLRVLYEDPEQRAERQRLANLVGESMTEEIPKTPNR